MRKLSFYLFAILVTMFCVYVVKIMMNDISHFRLSTRSDEQAKITCSHANRYYIANGTYNRITNTFKTSGYKNKIYLLNSNCMVEVITK